MTTEGAIADLETLLAYIPIYRRFYQSISMGIKALEQEPKTGHCKDCKWWKDSDGVFRRGIGAESQCPMNHIEVFEGNGYCYMFEPRGRSNE